MKQDKHSESSFLPFLWHKSVVIIQELCFYLLEEKADTHICTKTYYLSFYNQKKHRIHVILSAKIILFTYYLQFYP